MRSATEITNELIASGLSQSQTALLFELVLILSTVSVDASSDNRGGPLESTVEQARKERDKTRKRAERAAKKAAQKVAETSTDSPRTVHGQSEVCPTVEDKKEGLPVGKERKKGSRLLVGTRVSDEQRSIAIECGCPPDRVDAVWTEFVDYWSDVPGARGLKLTWTGTWRNRVKAIFKNGQRTSNHRTDPAAGRATAREAHQVAAMGGAGLRYLQEGKPAGPERGSPDGFGTAEVYDLRKRAENAG